MQLDIYTRISRDGEGAGMGVARQEKDCRAHLKKLGYDVGLVLEDNDVGAYTGRRKRPAYEQLLQRLRDRDSDGFVVWHLDRLTRRPRELEDVIDIMEETGAVILSVTGGEYDLTTSDGQAMARIIGTFSRKASDDHSRRITRKHLEMAQTGRAPGGARHFGYEPLRVDGKPLLVDDEGYPTLKVRESEATLIREAAAAVLAGRSLYSVVKEWNDRGVHFGKGGKVNPSSLKHILGSPTIAGWRGLHREFVTPGRWEAIIDRDTQAEVLAVLNSRSTFKEYRGERTYLLSGMVVCGKCGQKMTAQAHGRAGRETFKRSYMCPTIPGRKHCGSMRVVAEQTEQEVLDRILSVIDKAIPQTKMDDSTRPLQVELADIETRLATLVEDYYVHSRITPAQFHRANAKLTKRETELHAALSTTAARRATPSIRSANELRDAWDDMDIGQRRAVIAQFVDAVVIQPSSTRGRFDPNRVTVKWL